MKASMYTMSVPILVRMLNNLAGILDKAAAYAETRKIDHAVLLNSRLFPDMFPLAMQVRIACDFARGCGARLTGGEPPKIEDNETTLGDLKQRVLKSMHYLEGLRAAQFDGADERRIVRTVGSREIEFSAYEYLAHFVLPNFYFHVATTYNILRKDGVDLGKRDFVGPL